MQRRSLITIDLTRPQLAKMGWCARGIEARSGVQKLMGASSMIEIKPSFVGMRREHVGFHVIFEHDARSYDDG